MVSCLLGLVGKGGLSILGNEQGQFWPIMELCARWDREYLQVLWMSRAALAGR